jgi:hypothetical protein
MPNRARNELISGVYGRMVLIEGFGVTGHIHISMCSYDALAVECFVASTKAMDPSTSSIKNSMVVSLSRVSHQSGGGLQSRVWDVVLHVLCGR